MGWFQKRRKDVENHEDEDKKKDVFDSVDEVFKSVDGVFDNVSKIMDDVAEQVSSNSKGDKMSEGTFCIKVNGKIVYEGKTGSVEVTQSGGDINMNSYSNVAIINGKVISSSVSGSKGVEVKVEGDVYGNVSAPMGISCGNVTGDVNAKMGVNCGDISGNAQAGMSINCK